MINQEELKKKMDEAMRMLNSYKDNSSEVKPGNLESLIQTLSGEEDSPLVDNLSSLHSVLDEINKQAMELMKTSSYKPVRKRCESRPKKVQ